jgi:cytidine deaminase
VKSLPVTEVDLRLVEAARETMRRLYRPRKHHVAAALRTKQGRIYTAVHVEAHVGRVAICAEAAALCKAVSEGETEFECIVAVRHPRDHEPNRELQIVSPCGMCRELLSDYAEDLSVIFSENGEPKKAPLSELFPHKYDH